MTDDDVVSYVVRLREIYNELPEGHDLRIADQRYLLGVAEAATLLWVTHEDFGGVLSAAEMAYEFKRLSAALHDELGPAYGLPVASPPETA